MELNTGSKGEQIKGNYPVASLGFTGRKEETEIRLFTDCTKASRTRCAKHMARYL